MGDNLTLPDLARYDVAAMAQAGGDIIANNTQGIDAYNLNLQAQAAEAARAGAAQQSTGSSILQNSTSGGDLTFAGAPAESASILASGNGSIPDTPRTTGADKDREYISGQVVKYKISDLTNKERREAMSDEARLYARQNPISSKVEAKVVYAKGEFFDPINIEQQLLGIDNGESSFGVFLSQTTKSGYKISLGKEGFEGKADISSTTALNYTEGDFAGGRAVVRSIVDIGADSSLTIGVKNDRLAVKVGGGVDAIASAVNAHVTHEKDFDLFFLNLKVKNELDLYAGGIGGSISGSAGYEDGKFKASVKLGAVPLIGAREKLGVELVPKQTYINSLSDAIFDYKTGNASFVEVASRPQVNPLARFNVGGWLYDRFY